MARLATSLVTLRNEINAFAPNRSKVSDGWIGDTAHSARCSRHNPNNAGVVCAIDVTHDPSHGCDIHSIADRVRRNPHPQLAYMISAGRIAGRSTGWQWRTYTGANGHYRHAHFGVGAGGDCEPTQPYDSTQPWGIKSAPAASSGGDDEVQLRTLRKGNVGGDVKSLQLLLEGKAGQRVNHDGRFTDGVETGVRNVQRFFGLTVDGVVGPKTWGVLFL
jgi:hypothetical protein